MMSGFDITFINCLRSLSKSAVAIENIALLKRSCSSQIAWQAFIREILLDNSYIMSVVSFRFFILSAEDISFDNL